MANHPEHVEDIQKAIRFLKSEGLNKSRLTMPEREALLGSIQATIQQDNKAKQRKLFRLLSVASVAVGHYRDRDQPVNPIAKRGCRPGQGTYRGRAIEHTKIFS